MGSHQNLIRESIIRDMSEGVMTIGFDGVITYLNPAAEVILDRAAGKLVGASFAKSFFEYAENDAFNQAILDAAYDRKTTHENIVPYFTGSITRQLHVTTSFLHDNGEKVGIIAVLRDISELAELRDAVKAMEQIKLLNSRLELRNKLLSETFGRFLSDEIVRQILETPDGLMMGGKKRTLTIMMSDLRGFTAISERMEAQNLITMLNHYLGEMTEIIQSREGTIIEFIGDGIMAIFGAPAPSESHAENAVAAAVEMEARMEAINSWNAERGFPRLEMGIGIHTGEVIVGNIGSEKRTKYGVVGSHVNLCGRIESYTVGGQILISPGTREMIQAPLEILSVKEVFPKGVQEPIQLSHVTGIGEPYQVYCRQWEETPVALKTPVPVYFVIIHEKHCDRVQKTARITALSRTGAVLETDDLLEPFENLRIDIGEELFAKVISGDKNGWLLRFTSIPSGFDEWRKKLGE